MPPMKRPDCIWMCWFVLWHRWRLLYRTERGHRFSAKMDLKLLRFSYNGRWCKDRKANGKKTLWKRSSSSVKRMRKTSVTRVFKASKVCFVTGGQSVFWGGNILILRNTSSLFLSMFRCSSESNEATYLCIKRLHSPYSHGGHFPLTSRSGWEAQMLLSKSHTGCKSYKRMESDKSLSFHRFPTDQRLQRQWIVKIWKDIVPYFKVKQHIW